MLVLLGLSSLYHIAATCLGFSLLKKEGEIHIEDLDKMVIDQKLDPFYRVLKDKQKDTWIREEVVCKERISMQRLTCPKETGLMTKLRLWYRLQRWSFFQTMRW